MAWRCRSGRRPETTDDIFVVDGASDTDMAWARWTDGVELELDSLSVAAWRSTHVEQAAKRVLIRWTGTIKKTGEKIIVTEKMLASKPAELRGTIVKIDGRQRIQVRYDVMDQAAADK
eukprot:3842241-Pyramimonas_sp.AAC.1